MSEGTRLRKEKRQESILKSASKVLSEEGIDGMSMRKIAKAEGISEAMLYRFYKNKYQILQTLLEINVQKIIGDWSEIIETVKALVPEPEVSFPVIGKKLAKTITDNQEFFRVIMREGPKIRRLFRDINQEQRQGPKGLRIFQNAIQSLNVLGVLTNYFERCKKAGNLRNDLSPEECAMIVISNLVPLMSYLPPFIFQESTQEIDITKLVETQIKIMLYGIVRK